MAGPAGNGRNPSKGSSITPEQGLVTLSTNQNTLWNSFKATVSQTPFMKILIQQFWSGAKGSVTLKLLSDSHAQPGLRTTSQDLTMTSKTSKPLRNHRTYDGRRGIEQKVASHHLTERYCAFPSAVCLVLPYRRTVLLFK